MTSPLYTCPHCGANLSLDQLRGTDCPYCRSAFPHHARAVEHAALVNQVMANNVAAFAFHAPIVPAVPVLHIQANAMNRINTAIAATVAIAIAFSIGLTIALAVVLG